MTVSEPWEISNEISSFSSAKFVDCVPSSSVPSSVGWRDLGGDVVPCGGDAGAGRLDLDFFRLVPKGNGVPRAPGGSLRVKVVPARGIFRPAVEQIGTKWLLELFTCI